MTQYQKVKSAAKLITPKGKGLNDIVLDTMGKISAIVGATLGPGGMPVLIEREEHDLPSFVTKDGVTVYRALGFEQPIAHAILESARDASIRTASEAGDGTTTATVLSAAIVTNTMDFVAKNRKLSPQRVVRMLSQTFDLTLEPLVRQMAIKVDSTSSAGKQLMHQIACTSANGDVDLANAVLEAFAVTGDEGNVTIVEASGPSKYEVEKISGYPMQMGYEDAMARFYSKFINDVGNQRVLLDDPVVVLYDGKLTEIQTFLPAWEVIAQAWVTTGFNHNVILVAHGFSESVLGHLATNFNSPNSTKIVPLLVPMSAQLNGQRAFLEDLAAVTGATIFDPLNKPLDSAELDDFGPVTDETPEEPGSGLRQRCRGIKHLEMYRFRSTLVGIPDNEETSDRLLVRMDQLKQQQTQAGASELDRNLIQERIAKLTGGIARLKCFGASNGELKEKRDRAEDAVCAVRGALKHGALPGGAWVFQYLAAAVEAINDPTGALAAILIPSLQEPFIRILTNAGYSAERVETLVNEGTPTETTEYSASEVELALSFVSDNALALFKDPEESLESAFIVNITTGKPVSALAAGVVDSLPAVLEALRNSISIASLLGTLGGCVVFGRDAELERKESRDASSFNRMANSDANGADERA